MEVKSLIDWDYEFACPKCGEEYTWEHDPDFTSQVKVITCDECGEVFTVKSHARLEIEVEINPSKS